MFRLSNLNDEFALFRRGGNLDQCDECEADWKMLVVEPVQAAIWHCLNHYAYTDATFLAEKLMAESGSDEAVFLAATCYYRQGNLEQAHHLLSKEGTNTPSAKFLMAKCCTELKKDSEAESLIRGPLADKRKEIQIDDIVSNFGDKSVFALQLLSKICRRSERHKNGRYNSF